MKFLRTCSMFTLIVTSMLPVGGMSQTVSKTTPHPANAQHKQPASPLSIDCPGLNPSARAVKANSQTPMPAPKGKTYGKAPLSFELNQGQTDPQVKFLTRGSGYNLFLTDTEVVMVTNKPAAAAERAERKTAAQKQGQDSRALNRRDSRLPVAPRAAVSNIVRMKLVGANAQPKITGLDEATKKTNLYLGRDSSKWHTNIPNYKRVKYENALPNIDMDLHGDQGSTEYDFIVRPGATPADITLNFEGVRSLRIDSGGDLVMQLTEGKLLHRKPYIYQETAGKKREIAGKYVLKGTNRVGFEVGAYDKTQPLIIDPVIVYATYLGGSDRDLTVDIAVDSAGNAVVTGVSTSVNFPVSNAIKSSTTDDYYDGFVTKLNADGTDVVYSTYLGGMYGEDGVGIAADSSGNAYVTGFTMSPDFPVSNDAFQSTGGGTCSEDALGDVCSDAFLTKFSPAGALVYSTYLGGSEEDIGRDVAVDTAGNAYVTGDTESTNFPTLNGFQTGNGGGRDAFMAKVNATGTALLYSTYLGGSGYEFGRGVAVDNVGGAYVSGLSASSVFPTTPGAFNTGASHGYVTKFNTTATGSNSIGYSTHSLGGSRIAADETGSAYVVDDGVAKLNPSGSALIYRTPLPATAAGPATANMFAIGIDADHNAFVTGQTGIHVYLARMNAEGLVDYAISIGGSGASSGGAYPSYKGEHVRGVAIDPMGNVYVTGWTSSADFPVTPGAFQTVLPANMEENPYYNESSFVLKVTDCPCACPAIPAATPRTP